MEEMKRTRKRKRIGPLWLVLPYQKVLMKKNSLKRDTGLPQPLLCSITWNIIPYISSPSLKVVVVVSSRPGGVSFARLLFLSLVFFFRRRSHLFWWPLPSLDEASVWSKCKKMEERTPLPVKKEKKKIDPYTQKGQLEVSIFQLLV